MPRGAASGVAIESFDSIFVHFANTRKSAGSWGSAVILATFGQGCTALREERVKDLRATRPRDSG